jgi:hypothetical protein
MRFLAAAALAAAALTLTGCPNPNSIGVQTYGSIKVVATDGSTGKPVVGAYASAGSTLTCQTLADGSCVLPSVPIGKWTVHVAAPGLNGSADVTVTENSQATAVVSMNP